MKIIIDSASKSIDKSHSIPNDFSSRNCIRNYIENSFYQQGQCIFTCLNPSCQSEYSTVVMGQLLSPTVFSRLLIKIQQEELRRANIPNFEQCKFCTFGTSTEIGVGSSEENDFDFI